ncbi:T9SS type A sorting domain-containing protein [Aequorivita xiaoshiensis]|uniref:T9SS type A sorting domain-containing protein n=1 Tax=Aequorivita xiaoshiensis TaxID=2874476 RepID=A0A9X1U445_9FLAO|nr:T9SS type A sorting domain-containing protein [Aequorivita xiaoshiensis]MCG2431549.1 T9SS type A sorting domain-containing protein [Aequorivita xiaoshiensis]
MKKQLLLLSFLLIATGVFAQLTVKPNGTADSYIYVKDQIVYVENDINLTRNSTANGTEASIYLRDNGQLIQGGTTSTNTGDGFLSVKQNTNPTNTFAYYYWCSPVGNPAAATSVGNNSHFGINSIYEELDGALGTDAQMAANVGSRNGFTIPQLTISRRWIYTHPTPGSEAEGNYVRINADNTVSAGLGFTMKGVNTGGNPGNIITGTGSNHDQVYEFRGRPNSGSFTIPVAAPVDGVSQMTLSGNPYPSALDLNQLFYDTGNNELGAFWYYDEDRGVASHLYTDKPFGYGVYTPGLEDPDGDLADNNPAGNYVQASFYIWNAGGTHTGTTAGNGGSNQNKRYAPIGQGIMFVGQSDGNVTIKNSHRIFVKEGAPGSEFQRPSDDVSISNTRDIGELTASLPSELDTRDPQTRIYAVFDDALTRDMLLVFSDLATDGYDRGYDGLSPMGVNTDAYFPIGNDSGRLPYVINAVNYEENKQIPINFKLNKTTEIKLLIAEEVKKPYEKIYLYDRQDNSFRRIGTRLTFPFSLTLDAGHYDNRFFIVFKKAEYRNNSSTASIEDQERIISSVAMFQNNPQKQLEISNPEGHTIKSAIVYDMNGKMVIQKQNLGTNNSYSFYTGSLSDGVYLVKLTTKDDITIDYKAIVHNK